MSVAYIESDLTTHLLDHIDTYGLPETFDPVVHIKYASAPFDPPNDQPFLALTLHVNGLEHLDANKCKSHIVGIFNVRLCYPREVGSLEPGKIADRINHYFTNNYDGGVGIEMSYVRPLYNDDWTIFDVVVHYRYEQVNTNGAYI